MAISTEGKIGIALGLIGLAGAGALVVAPAPWVTAVGWTLISVAAVGGIALGVHHFQLAWVFRKSDGYLRPWVGILFACIILGAGYTGSHWPREHALPPLQPQPPAPASRLERTVFLCLSPSLPASADQIAKAREHVKQAVEIYAAGTGIPVTFSEIDNGIAYEVRYPNGSGPHPDILSDRFEVRRFEDKLLITNIVETKIDSKLIVYKTHKPGDKDFDTLIGLAETLAGVRPGGCKAL